MARVAVDEPGVLPAYFGTVVHDALSVYDGDKYATATHALCGAHIIRELTAVAEQHPDAEWPPRRAARWRIWLPPPSRPNSTG